MVETRSSSRDTIVEPSHLPPLPPSMSSSCSEQEDDLDIEPVALVCPPTPRLELVDAKFLRKAVHKRPVNVGRYDAPKNSRAQAFEGISGRDLKGGNAKGHEIGNVIETNISNCEGKEIHSGQLLIGTQPATPAEEEETEEEEQDGQEEVEDLIGAMFGRSDAGRSDADSGDDDITAHEVGHLDMSPRVAIWKRDNDGFKVPGSPASKMKAIRRSKAFSQTCRMNASGNMARPAIKTDPLGRAAVFENGEASCFMSQGDYQLFDGPMDDRRSLTPGPDSIPESHEVVLHNEEKTRKRVYASPFHTDAAGAHRNNTPSMSVGLARHGFTTYSPATDHSFAKPDLTDMLEPDVLSIEESDAWDQPLDTEILATAGREAITFTTTESPQLVSGALALYAHDTSKVSVLRHEKLTRLSTSNPSAWLNTTWGPSIRSLEDGRVVEYNKGRYTPTQPDCERCKRKHSSISDNGSERPKRRRRSSSHISGDRTEHVDNGKALSSLESIGGVHEMDVAESIESDTHTGACRVLVLHGPKR